MGLEAIQALIDCGGELEEKGGIAALQHMDADEFDKSAAEKDNEGDTEEMGDEKGALRERGGSEKILPGEGAKIAAVEDQIDAEGGGGESVEVFSIGNPHFLEAEE